MNSSNWDGVPMTSDEMIERSTSWTLGCDNALLNRLRSISETLERNSEEITRDCESLSSDVSVLQAKLFNVTNQFLMVSNSQFVENRVQEFEEGVSNSQSSATATGSLNRPKVKTKSEKEAELIAKMKDAIQIGVLTHENHLTSLPLEKQQTSPNLCLPHLIGSSKFFSSRYVGLADDNPPRASSRLPEPNLATSSDFTVNNQATFMQYETVNHKPENISASTIKESEVGANTFPYPSSNLQSTIPERPANDPSVIKSPASIYKPPSNYQSTRDDMDSFENATCPPPPRYTDMSDESDDDFKPPSIGGGRLFLDDDDDLFNDSSLFVSKPDENLFFGIKNAMTNQTQPSSIIEPPPFDRLKDKSRASNVSRESDVGRLPENDNISAPSPLPVQPKDSHFPFGENQVNSIEDDNIYRSKIPPGGVSVFGSVPPGKIPRLKKQLSSQAKKVVVTEKGGDAPGIIVQSQNPVINSSEPPSVTPKDDRATTSHSSPTSKGMTSSQRSLYEPTTSVTRSNKTRNGIFDEDSDEDIFSSNRKRPVTKIIKGSSDLFNESISSNKVLVSADLSQTNIQSVLPKSKLKTSIFDDSESDDDLFSSASSSTSSKTKDKIQSNLFLQTNSMAFNARNKNVSPNLFGDDSNADLFANVTSVDSKSSNANDPTLDMSQEDIHGTDESIENSRMTGIEIAKEEIRPNMDKIVDKEFNQHDLDRSSQTQLIDPVSDLHKDSEVVSDNDPNRDSDSQPQNLNTIEPSETVASTFKSKTLTDTVPHSEPEAKTINEICEKQDQPVGSKAKKLSKEISPNTKVMGKKDFFENKQKSSGDFDSKNLECRDDSNKINSEITAKSAGVIKTKVSVKALASGLNLNPLAMRPGAKAPKLGSIDKSDSIVSSGTESPSRPATPESPIKTMKTIIVPEGLSNSPSRVSPERVEPSQLLPNLSKGRVKITVKRRPPSKQLLKSYVIAKEEEMKKYNDEIQQEKEDIEVETVPILQQAEVDLKINSASNIVAEVISPSTDEEDVFPVPDAKISKMPSEECDIINEPEQLEIKSSRSKSNPEKSLTEDKDSFKTVSSINEKPAEVPTKKNISLWEDSDSDDLFIASAEKGEMSRSAENVIDHKDLFSTSPTKDLLCNSNEEKDSQLGNLEKNHNNVGTEDVQLNGAIPSHLTDTAENMGSKLDTQTVKTEKGSINNRQGGKNLFSDDEDDVDSIFKTQVLPSTTTESLRSDQEKITTTDRPTTQKSITSSTKKGQKGLFDSDSGEDDSDDLFHSSSKPKTNSAPSINDSTKENGKPSSSKPKKTVVKKGRKKTATTNSIFNDSSDDDLFASSKSTNKKSAKA